jgi:hypothetical protein
MRFADLLAEAATFLADFTTFLASLLVPGSWCLPLRAATPYCNASREDALARSEPGLAVVRDDLSSYDAAVNPAETVGPVLVIVNGDAGTGHCSRNGTIR